MVPALIIHGGAGTVPPEAAADVTAGLREAVLAGWSVLVDSGSATDAIVAAITRMENHPAFNAGTGAVLTAKGTAELDAGLMEGTGLNIGAVAGVTKIKNPMALARQVLVSPHVLLVGQGAEAFAQESGIGFCDPASLVTAHRRAEWQQYQASANAPRDGHHGTVGACAIDVRGHCAAGCSTGGILGKHPGRVGDSPLPGCGYYAEDGVGATAGTGQGEAYIQTHLALRTAMLLQLGSAPGAAAHHAIELLHHRVGGVGGIIVLGASGDWGAANNDGGLPVGYISAADPEPYCVIQP